MSTSIEVAVRVRPFNSREIKYGSQLIVDMAQMPNCEVQQVKNGKLLKDVQPKKFTFDHCFWTHDKESKECPVFADQKLVYDSLGQKILDNSMKGFNGCLFAYGQTGSGKTYSMMGIESDPGVIPRLCQDLFKRVSDLKASNSITVECSYLEIYNENVRDLLNPASYEKSLKVRQHPKLGVFVDGLTKLFTKSTEEIEKLLDDGGKVRSVAATQMNATSSRSHAILTLYIKNRNKDGELASQLHLVDLAGSERATSTGATGDTLTEGANINKSLTVLGMCLSRLAEVGDKSKKGHIPFRDSQLTWLLNDSLGGNAKTAMLANISPASINYEETLSTLRFAMTVKKIKNHAKVNEDPQQKLIRELREEIDEIKKKIKEFEGGKGPAQPVPEAAVDEENKEQERDAAAEKHVDPTAETAAPPEENAAAASPKGKAVDGEEDDECATPTEEAQPKTKEELVAMLMDNTRLFAEVGLSDEQRMAKDAQAKASRQKAMKALNESGVQVDPTLPRLVTLNENLHAFPSVALLYYLRAGDNNVGSKEGRDEAAAKLAAKQLEREGEPKEGEGADDSTAATKEEGEEDTHKRVHIVLPNGQQGKSSSSPTKTGGSSSFSEIKVQHAVFHVDALKRTVHVSKAHVEDKSCEIWVNGELIQTEQEEEGGGEGAADWKRPVQLHHLDRVIIGSFAFRHSQPVAWYSNAGEDEFSRNCSTLPHLESIERHERLELEKNYETELLEELSKLFDQQGGPAGEGEDDAQSSNAGLSSEQALTIKNIIDDELEGITFQLGESDTMLCNEFPLTQEAIAQMAAEKGDMGLQYDYQYAVDEKGKRRREEEKKKRDEDLKKLQEEKQREIDELASATKEQDAAIAQLEKELAAQNEAKQKMVEEQKALEQEKAVAKEKEAAAEAAKRKSRESSSHEMLELAKQLDAHEQECRDAQLWKPTGPTRESDRDEYRFSTSKDCTYGAVQGKGEVHLEMKVHKLRIKKGLFSRTGYHPVKIVVRPSFLYYFDEKCNDNSPALGAVYLYGCLIQTLKKSEVIEGRNDAMRFVPCVPRKPSKNVMSPTDDNNVILAFDTPKDKQDLTNLVVQLSQPVAPPNVAEYLRAEEEKERQNQE